MGASCVRWTADTERAFLLALRLTGQVQQAAAAIGRAPSVCYQRRDRRPDFAAAWAATVADMEREKLDAAQAATSAAGAPLAGPGWRTRRDGWTEQRRRAFCRALADTGSYAKAAARVGLSTTSALRARKRCPDFQTACEQALAEGAPTPQDAALQRAVDGWDEPVFQGGRLVGYRRRYSDTLLRALIGRERAEARGPSERRGREAWRPRPLTPDDARESILRKLEAIAAHDKAAKRAAQLAWCERMEREGKAP